MKHKRTYAVAAAVAAVVLILSVSPVKPGWNRSESLPLGLYLSTTYSGTAPLERGQLACVPYVRPSWAQGNYLYPGELLCKHVVGIPGDVVNTRVDGFNEVCHGNQCESVGKPLERDSAGRPMQHITWHGEVIPPNTYYFASTRRPNSMDSRYIGLVKQSTVAKTLRPVWTKQDN